MPKSFNLSTLFERAKRRQPALASAASWHKSGLTLNTRFWLLAGGGALLLANLVIVFLTVFPPGGSEAELAARRDQLRTEIRLARTSTTRLRTVSDKVETGSQQATSFESQYFLPERLAYSAIIAEIQRMAKAASVEEREAVYSKEPIEGSDDLSILNAGARFRGTYANLVQFLNESDKSPMLLMIDTVRATPEQRGGQIDAEIRFQAVIHDDQALIGAPIGGQP
ncbi:MAG TPA: hypothetical protein VH351_11595 [Bryobacteraceae bacterium]|jgi:type II secretory pathway component PulM|nr:hypothetical protein [Bryobacteraceae bacterium]